MPSGIDTMLTLRAEIAACLIAVALLGLLAGWMMQRSRAARRLRESAAAWEARYAELEDRTQRDAGHLEERLQGLAGELRGLTAENRQLRESSRGEGDTLDEARAEALERNRRQAEAQERLQRIISEREVEIATLRAELETLRGHSDTDPVNRGRGGGSSRLVAGSAADTGGGRNVDGSLPGADAVAAAEGFDETIRIEPSQLPGAVSAVRDERPSPARDPLNGGSSESRSADERDPAAEQRPADGRAEEKRPAEDAREEAADQTLDSTMDIGLLDAEEATVALDEKTLALVRGIGGGGKG